MARDEYYAQIEDSLRQAKSKAAKDGKLDHDRDGEHADLQRLIDAAAKRQKELRPEAAPQEPNYDLREPEQE